MVARRPSVGGAVPASTGWAQPPRRSIGQFQALRFALADMAAEVAQARAYWQQVAHLLDEGLPAESESAGVKLLATEMAVRVTNQAMQLHGGNGYTTERRIERYWRDARLTTIDQGLPRKNRFGCDEAGRFLPRPVPRGMAPETIPRRSASRRPCGSRTG